MYRDFYRMTKDPFALHPSPEDYFRSKSHDHVLHLLMESVKLEEPNILVTGEYGVGKTLLCLKLCQFLETDGTLSAITVPAPSPSATYSLLLRSIALQLKVTEQFKLCKTVTHFEEALFTLYISGKINRSLYFVIDDLQDYEQQMLVRFKYLANFHVQDFFPFRLICFAHSDFIQDLKKDPKFVPFLQRFRRRLHIQPLEKNELKEYIYFRMLKAGARGRPLFDDESLSCIADFSGRIPRQINNLCDRILRSACERKADRIYSELVRDVGNMDQNAPPPLMNSDEAAVGTEKTIGGFKSETINLHALTIDNDAKREINDDVEQEIDTATSSPVVQLARRHPWLIGIILVELLLICLMLLLHFSQEKDNPSPTKDGKIDYHYQSSKDVNEDSILKWAVVPDENQASKNSSGENSPDRQISIHQPTTSDSSAAAKETAILLGEKPYTLEVFSGSNPADIEKELKRLQDKGLAPVFVSETGTDRKTTKWNVCLGSFISEQDAISSPLSGKVPGAKVRYLPFTLLLTLTERMEDIEGWRKTLEIDGFHPWLERMENGQYRLLLGAYPSRKEAHSRLRDLQEEGIKAFVVRR